MINPDALLTCSEFRVLRDLYALQRRTHVLPQLNARKTALRRDLDVLYRQHDRAAKHDKQIIENNMRPLQVDYQYISGQVAVIEREREALTARVPEQWRVEFFTLKGAA